MLYEGRLIKMRLRFFGTRPRAYMKYVVCTPEEPIALYNQEVLADLGSHAVDHLGLADRTDVIHFLSHMAPCMSRGSAMSPEDLHNLLMVSGYQHTASDSKYCTPDVLTLLTNSTSNRDSDGAHLLVIKGVLPSKAYKPIPIDVTVSLVAQRQQSAEESRCQDESKVDTKSDRQATYRVNSLRFQITDSNRCI